MNEKFELGQVFITPGAEELLRKHEASMTFYLKLHASGNWGDLSEEDKKQNDEALKDNMRGLMSSYKVLDEEKIWIITDYGRETTTILLPEEY